MSAPGRGVLYHVVCAASPALDVAGAAVPLARQAGWDVCVIVTPRVAQWVDLDRIAQATGRPVRSDYKKPGEPDVLPPPDAFLVAPATFNTINKWANGIADTLVLGLLTEALGLGVPIVVVPWLNAAQAAHPAFSRSVQTLRDAGATVLLADNTSRADQAAAAGVTAAGLAPLPPGQTEQVEFPWRTAVDALPR